MTLFDETQDTPEEREELFKQLTEFALKGEHHEWEYIKHTSAYWVLKHGMKGMEKVIKLFDTLATATYNAYCKQVAHGIGEFPVLYAYTQYLNCKKFYEEEYAIAEDMLEEYWAYVWSGHFMDQWLFGRERETWHLWDHRQEGPHGS